MNLTIQQGWQCPVCQHVYSPTTPMCYHCPPKATAQTSTGTPIQNMPHSDIVKIAYGIRHGLADKGEHL